MFRCAYNVSGPVSIEEVPHSGTFFPRGNDAVLAEDRCGSSALSQNWGN